MLNCPTSQRKKQYQDLNDFTQKIDKEIMETISTLGWTAESIEIDDDSKLICPYDSSHQIGKKMLDQHLESCQWKQEGYNEFDTAFPESSLPLNSHSSITFDLSLQNSILQEAKKVDPSLKIGLDERLVPRTSNRIFTDFTCDERKILYDYVVSNTVKPDIGHDITDIQKLKNEDKEDKKLSFLELLIQERNLKRRRAKHRGVHTNKKSHTEILREVIHQQMELYTDYITETQRSPNNSTKNAAITEIQSFDASDHHECSTSRSKQKYECFEKSHTSYERDSEREKSSRITSESRKTQKSHKRKRSRSRERDYDRKSKHGSTRTHKKNNVKSYESEKLCDKYSKRSIDRREDREKLVL